MAINGRNYGSSDPSMPHFSKDSLTSPTTTVNLGKIFGIMFIWLIITAGIAIGLGFLFNAWLYPAPGYINRGAQGPLLGILIGSGIALIILTFIIQYFALRKGKGMIVLSSIYVLLMGVLCSSLTLYIDWYILGIALGISAAIFAVLALIGFAVKNVRPIVMVALMLFLGAGITALVTWIIILCTGLTGSTVMWLWIIDFAIFAGMLLMVIVDMSQIKRICEQGQVTTNITLYCALTLYTDFIYIFIKIATYLAIAYGKSK